jgi:RNA polymerase sigma-70 factor (ECF subfamily)
MGAGLLSHRATTRRRTAFPLEDAARPPDVFRAMYSAHAGHLLAYAKHLTRDRLAAEDAVQETFLRAWRELPRLMADDRPPRAWLRLVLRHIVIDTARANRLRETRLIDDTLLDQTTDGGYETLLDRELLVGALGTLSSLHREVLVEVYLRDRPPDRVAAGLGVPVGTVRSRLHYALNALRHQLSTGALSPECA